jgi:hypothetical protein
MAGKLDRIATRCGGAVAPRLGRVRLSVCPYSCVVCLCLCLPPLSLCVRVWVYSPFLQGAPEQGKSLDGADLLRAVQRMITDNDRIKRELNDKQARIEAQNERISELIAKNERLVDEKNSMVERRNDVRSPTNAHTEIERQCEPDATPRRPESGDTDTGTDARSPSPSLCAHAFALHISMHLFVSRH